MRLEQAMVGAREPERFGVADVEAHREHREEPPDRDWHAEGQHLVADLIGGLPP